MIASQIAGSLMILIGIAAWVVPTVRKGDKLTVAVFFMGLLLVLLGAFLANGNTVADALRIASEWREVIQNATE